MQIQQEELYYDWSISWLFFYKKKNRYYYFKNRKKKRKKIYLQKQWHVHFHRLEPVQIWRQSMSSLLQKQHGQKLEQLLQVQQYYYKINKRLWKSNWNQLYWKNKMKTNPRVASANFLWARIDTTVSFLKIIII